MAMARTRISTTVDAALLGDARRLRHGANDAALFDEALAALIARHRAAGRDAAYAAYDDHPLDEPDAWGDIASFREAAAGSRPSPATDGRLARTSGGWLVEVAGIEPASFGFSAGLLRAQPVSGSRASRSPPAPAGGPSQLSCPRRCADDAGGLAPLDGAGIRSAGLGPGRRRCGLGSEREVVFGACFWFRLFNVAPETTARFSCLDDRSRSPSPPCRLTDQCNPGPLSTVPAGPGPPPARPLAPRRARRWRGACRRSCVPGPGPAPPWPARP